MKLKFLNRKKLKRYLLPCMMLFFATIFLISAGVLAKRALEDHKQAQQNDQLANLVLQEQAQVQRPPISDSDSYVEPLSAFVEITDPVTGSPIKILREYASVYQLNPDMVGWLSIPNTTLNYPVVQRPDDPDYYLHRDFYKNNNRHGTIYAHAQANLQTPSDIVTIYGHNMSDGSMFATLHKYTKKEYYNENPYLYFDTLYEHRTYQIISVFEIDITKEGFAYHNYVNTNAFSFQYYVDSCKRLSMYDTGVPVKYGDKLITLSTCDKDTSTDNMRFVIVAKLVS